MKHYIPDKDTGKLNSISMRNYDLGVMCVGDTQLIIFWLLLRAFSVSFNISEQQITDSFKKKIR